MGGEYAHANREYPAQHLARQAQPLHFVEDQDLLQINLAGLIVQITAFDVHGKISTTRPTASSCSPF